MTPEAERDLRELLDRLARESGIARVGAAAKPNDRPRFKNGWLKDEREDLLERLDVELHNEPTPRGARYAAEHREEFERLLVLEAEHQKKILAEQRASSHEQADYEANRAELQRGEKVGRLEVDRNKIDEQIAGLRASAEKGE